MPREYSAPLEVVDTDCYTPLLTAVEYGQVQAFETLLELYAKPDTVDKDGKSVLFLAAESNCLKIIHVRASILRGFVRCVCACTRAFIHVQPDRV